MSVDLLSVRFVQGFKDVSVWGLLVGFVRSCMDECANVYGELGPRITWYTHIGRKRERERDVHTHIYIYIYGVCMHIHIFILIILCHLFMYRVSIF